MSPLDMLYHEWKRLRDDGIEAAPQVICHDCPELLEALQARIAAAIDSASVAWDSTGATNLLSEGTRTRHLESAPPDRAGRYVLESLLGRGGFGAVWLAYDPQLDRKVAIKLLHPAKRSSASEDALLAEARKLAALKHPNILSVHDAGKAGGRFYLVSALAAGGTLAAAIEQQPLEWRRSAELIAQVADALHHAHRAGIVHRDVKPQNILLDEHGRPMLADFGLAASEVELLDEWPGLMGTRGYMSPEQARGGSKNVDARTDIYSLGVVLYRMLSGRLPFVARSHEEYLDQVLHRDPRPLRTIDERIPERLDAICRRCLARQPGDRYSAAIDVARDLRELLERTWQEAPASPRKRSAFAAGIGLTLAAAACFVAVWSTGALQNRQRDLGPAPRQAPFRSAIAAAGDSSAEPSAGSVGLAPGGLAPADLTPAGLGQAGQATGDSSSAHQAIREAATSSPSARSADNARDAQFAKVDAPELGDFLRVQRLVFTPGATPPLVNTAQNSLIALAERNQFLSLGKTDDGSVDFQIEVNQLRWPGGVGLFWGYHLVDPKAPDVQYCSLMIEGVQNKQFSLVLGVHRFADPQGLHRTHVVAFGEGPAIPESSNTIRIRVDQGRLVELDVNGAPLPTFVRQCERNLRPDERGFRGDFGVRTDQAPATFSNPVINGRSFKFAP